MQKIEGLDLGDIFSEVEKEALAEKRKEVAKKVSGIVLNLQQWRYLRKEKTDEIKKLDGKIANAEEKLKGIREGKWELIPDDQKGQNQTGKNQGPGATPSEDD